MSQISQHSKLAVSITFTAADTLPSVPQQPNHVFCHIILWLVGVVPFSTNGNVFFCLQTLPACGHFSDKSMFLPFLPAADTKQAWRQCSQKSVADIIYRKSDFGRPARLSTQEVGRGGGLAAKFTRTSTDSAFSLLSSNPTLYILKPRPKTFFLVKSVYTNNVLNARVHE